MLKCGHVLRAVVLVVPCFDSVVSSCLCFDSVVSSCLCFAALTPVLRMVDETIAKSMSVEASIA